MNPDVEIQYVGADMASGVDADLFAQFQGVFGKFARPEELFSEKQSGAPEEKEEDTERSEAPVAEEEVQKVSKKKKKLMSRLSVAQLKQLVPRPDVVEAADVTSHDPRLLVFLKSYRSTVPVPRHWCSKRAYLAGKRGIERPPFQLPPFIAETGIAKIRESVLEAEAARKSSQKARDKLQVKMGKIDIDYQVLHDAFFKYQTKPPMTQQGDIYYEGKEFEIDLKEKKPGVFSEELVEALGMGEGQPPPWLINMQRYGPPPAYPNLLVPGLNAPLPPGCEYGFQAGGWGRPPVDEYGRPIYGDVFGQMQAHRDEPEEAVDKEYRWGEVLVAEDPEYDSDDEEEEEEGLGGQLDNDGLETPSVLDGISSTASLATGAGMETPDGAFDLRKRVGGADTPSDGSGTGVTGLGENELYRVIKEKQAHVGGALMGSDRTYALASSRGDVQVSVDPDALEDKSQLLNIYEDGVEEKAEDGGGREDLGENDPRNKRKRRAEATVASKKQRDFKF